MSNNNESAIVVKSKNFHELNRKLAFVSARCVYVVDVIRVIFVNFFKKKAEMELGAFS